MVALTIQKERLNVTIHKLLAHPEHIVYGGATIARPLCSVKLICACHMNYSLMKLRHKPFA
jgi:hypothetical protein